MTLLLGLFGYLILFTLLGLLIYRKSGFMRLPYGLKKSHVVDVVLLSIVAALVIDYVQASPSKFITGRDEQKGERRTGKKAKDDDTSPGIRLSEDETESGSASKGDGSNPASTKLGVGPFAKKSGDALVRVRKSSVSTYRTSNRFILRQKLKQTAVHNKKTTRRMENSLYKTQQTRNIPESQPSKTKSSPGLGRSQKKLYRISGARSTNYSKPLQEIRKNRGIANSKSSSTITGSKDLKTKSAPPAKTGKKRKPEAPPKPSVHEKFDTKKGGKPKKPQEPPR